MLKHLEYISDPGSAANLGIQATRGRPFPTYFHLQVEGWISAVVLVDGSIKGTWKYKNKNAETAVTVNLFSSVDTWVSDGIAAEAERLSKFLNTKVALEFTEN